MKVPAVELLMVRVHVAVLPELVSTGVRHVLDDVPGTGDTLGVIESNVTVVPAGIALSLNRSYGSVFSANDFRPNAETVTRVLNRAVWGSEDLRTVIREDLNRVSEVDIPYGGNVSAEAVVNGQVQNETISPSGTAKGEITIINTNSNAVPIPKGSEFIGKNSAGPPLGLRSLNLEESLSPYIRAAVRFLSRPILLKKP